MTKIQENISVKEKIAIKQPKNYNVIAHDNSQTSFEEVIYIISRCFEKTEEEAENVAHKVHLEKRGVCGVYSLEIAENKLVIVSLAKQFLITNYPHRASAISVLKFTIEVA